MNINILLFSAFIIIICIYYYIIYPNYIEPFSKIKNDNEYKNFVTSIQEYENCIKQGYPNNFCLSIPKNKIYSK